MSEPRARQPRSAAFGFIYASSVINNLSFGLMIPILPNLIRSFFGGVTADATASAAHWQFIFGATWGLMQFFCGPILGMLSDRYGRRPVLLISTFGLGVDFLIMAFAPSLPWLLLGRVLNGATAASFSTANAYVADISAPAERARNFGWMSSAFSIGFLFGPAVGGVISSYDWHLGAVTVDGLRAPFILAAALCAINWVYGLLVLPESLPPERRAPRFTWTRANPIAALSLLRSHHELLPLAGITFLFQLSQQVLPNLFVLYTTFRYHWSQQFLGVTFFITGALGILVQSFVVGPVVKRAGERGAVLIGAFFAATAYVIYALAPTATVYFIGMPVFALSNLMMPGLQGLMTQRVAPNEQGRLQGANQATSGIASILGPSIFPTAFEWTLRNRPGMPGLPILVAAGLMAIAFLAGLRVTPRRRPLEQTAP